MDTVCLYLVPVERTPIIWQAWLWSGRLKSPDGVAVDGEGNILVVEMLNHRIQKFTAEGQFLAAAGTSGSEPLQYCYPTDIAYNAKNSMVYVVDFDSDCVRVLNSDLTYSSPFGKNGSGMGQFNSPGGVACDSTGKVYVADTWNHRIKSSQPRGSS